MSIPHHQPFIHFANNFPYQAVNSFEARHGGQQFNINNGNVIGYGNQNQLFQSNLGFANVGNVGLQRNLMQVGHPAQTHIHNQMAAHAGSRLPVSKQIQANVIPNSVRRQSSSPQIVKKNSTQFNAVAGNSFFNPQFHPRNLQQGVQFNGSNQLNNNFNMNFNTRSQFPNYGAVSTFPMGGFKQGFTIPHHQIQQQCPQFSNLQNGNAFDMGLGEEQKSEVNSPINSNKHSLEHPEVDGKIE